MKSLLFVVVVSTVCAVSLRALEVATGGVQLSGWLWTDGIVERVDAPLYLVLRGNTPSDATSADVYVSPKHARSSGPIFSITNGTDVIATINADGTIAVSKGVLAGPGTGSGNVALQPQMDCDGCYLTLLGRLVGGGTHPAFHGATTLGNKNRCGEGEYVLQAKDGEHTDMFLDCDGSPQFMGPDAWFGDGEPATLRAHGGLWLDAGDDFTFRWRVDGEELVGVVSDGTAVREVRLPLVGPP